MANPPRRCSESLSLSAGPPKLGEIPPCLDAFAAEDYLNRPDRRAPPKGGEERGGGRGVIAHRASSLSSPSPLPTCEAAPVGGEVQKALHVRRSQWDICADDVVFRCLPPRPPSTSPPVATLPSLHNTAFINPIFRQLSTPSLRHSFFGQIVSSFSPHCFSSILAYHVFSYGPALRRPPIAAPAVSGCPHGPVAFRSRGSRYVKNRQSMQGEYQYLMGAGYRILGVRAPGPPGAAFPPDPSPRPFP